MPIDRLLDVAIVGAGLAGVVHLHYARQAGLDAVVFEQRAGVGGLWRELPSWQDIQIGTADWALGDLPLHGPMQPQVLANIEAWVERFGLADGIQLNAAVRGARHTGRCWELDLPQGPVRARHLVAASGGHNRPIVPPQRRDGTVRELHASALREPRELTGRVVVVVGGGASALDLLDQCLEHAARHIVWVHRGLRWFVPTGKPKAVAGSVRPFARMQASGMAPAAQTAAIGTDMLARYRKFGIESIRPERPWDVRHDQLMPGRQRMLAHFGALQRCRGEVAAVERGRVVLDDGTRLAADLLLWGTGYATDLSYFADPRLASLRSVAALAASCACIFRSVDAPDLYFPSVGLDGIGAAPWAYALIARSVMSHIRGTAQLDMQPTPDNINHFAIVQHLAARDPGTYTAARNWDFYRRLALDTPDAQPYPLP